MLFLMALSQGLLSLLSYREQDHQPWGGSAHNQLGPPSSITRKMPYKLKYSLILCRHFLNQSFLLDEHSLGQVDIKVASTCFSSRQSSVKVGSCYEFSVSFN